MKKTTIVIVFLAALVTLPVFAQKRAMDPFVMPTTASNGMGGHHVAYTDNVYSLLVNPAAMARVHQKNTFTLAPSLFNPGRVVGIVNSFKDIVKVAGDDPDNISGIANAVGDMLLKLSDDAGRIGFGAELREFPLSFAWVANGFGFGLWNRIFLNTNVLELNYDINVFADAMLPVGFAFKILDLENHSLDAGVTIKPFARVMFKKSDSITNLIDNVGIDDMDNLIDNLGLSIPIIVGGTFDAGLLYRWKPGLQFGLTFNDIYSQGKVLRNLVGTDNRDYYIPFTMNAGLAYDLDLAFLGFTLAADYRGITNIFNRDNVMSRNATLGLGVGLQVSLFNFVYARVGMNEMLPSAGAGLSLGAFKIDLAYYGKEFGLQPGDFSTAVFEANISIRPDAKERNWPWIRRSIVELFMGGE